MPLDIVVIDEIVDSGKISASEYVTLKTLPEGTVYPLRSDLIIRKENPKPPFNQELPFKKGDIVFIYAPGALVDAVFSKKKELLYACPDLVSSLSEEFFRLLI